MAQAEVRLESWYVHAAFDSLSKVRLSQHADSKNVYLDGLLVGCIAVLVGAVGAARMLPLDVGPDPAQLLGQVRQLLVWDEHLQ